MTIRCIAIDDEPYALGQMEDYINKAPCLQLVGLCKNCVEAEKIINEQVIDLIFIDIHLPVISGIDFVRKLSPNIPFIFTTAYSQYAIESYKLNALEYLLKPVAYSDFLRVTEKAQQVIRTNKMLASQQFTDEPIFIQSEGKLIKLILSNIDYIESTNEYVKFNLKNNTHLISFMRLKNLENLLPAKKFMRVHRSYIINLNNVIAFEKNRIIINEKTAIPIGKLYKSKYSNFLAHRINPSL